MTRWGEQTTNPLQRRDSQQSDARLRSVNQRVLRSDDSFFEYNDGTLIPVGGRSIVTALVAQSTDYTLLDNDGDYIEADPTSADVTITLPTAADNEGRTVTVRHVGSANSVILDGEGSEQVHGAATFELPDNGSVVVLRCDGTSWVWVSGHILGSNSNGEYVVFSSGLQVCWAQDSESGVNINYASAIGGYVAELSSVTFPKGFDSAPIVLCPDTRGAFVQVSGFEDISASAFVPRARAIDSVADRTVRFSYIARGKAG